METTTMFHKMISLQKAFSTTAITVLALYKTNSEKLVDYIFQQSP
jgi:hypothetical protein